MSTPAYDPPNEIQAFAAELVHKFGLNQASTELGLAKQTTLCLAMGLPVTRGTIAQAREVMRARGVEL